MTLWSWWAEGDWCQGEYVERDGDLAEAAMITTKWYEEKIKVNECECGVVCRVWFAAFNSVSQSRIIREDRRRDAVFSYTP